jgi:Tfp pilus assembly protein PilV
MVKRERDGERGFTVVEVLVATAVAVFGLAGALGLHMASARATSYTRHASEAAIVGEAKLEQLIVAQGAALVDGNDRVDATGTARSDGLFTRSWTVTPGTSTTIVTLTVAWTEDDGGHQITYSTRRAP